MPWSWGVLVHEGVATAMVGRWISAILVLAVCWTGALVSAADNVAVSRTLDDQQRWVEAGGRTFRVLHGAGGAAEEDIDDRACEALNLLDGVEAAVPLAREQQPVVLSDRADDGGVALIHAGPSIFRALRLRDDTSPRVIVSKDVARTWGIVDGEWVRLRPAPHTTTLGLPANPLQAVVADTTLLGDNFSTGVILARSGKFRSSACSVTADAAHLDALRIAVPGLLGPADVPRVENQVGQGRFARDYGDELKRRSLRLAWLPLGLAWAMLWAFILWVRRSQDALLVSLGLHRRGQMIMRLVEWGLLTGVGTVWAISLGCLASMLFGVPGWLALQGTLRVVLPSCLIAAACVLLMIPSRRAKVMDQLKDR